MNGGPRGQTDNDAGDNSAEGQQYSLAQDDIHYIELRRPK